MLAQNYGKVGELVFLPGCSCRDMAIILETNVEVPYRLYSLSNTVMFCGLTASFLALSIPLT